MGVRGGEEVDKRTCSLSLLDGYAHGSVLFQLLYNSGAEVNAHF